MAVKKNIDWLLLLLRLPATHSTERVAIWRKLKKSGAIQIQTSTYVLPDEPARYETFQWLTQHIRDAGGDATLVRAREIEGLSDQKLIEQFNASRAKEYAVLRDTIRAVTGRSKPSRNLDVRLERIRRQFREIKQTDFFNCAKAHDVEMLLRKVGKIESDTAASVKINARSYRGRTWATRPRPEIDRVGSAWLIRKFIDPKAKFIFVPKVRADRRVVSFDILDGEFSHRGDDCTFETLTKSFRVQDKAVHKIGEMIHDADLDDNKFERSECIGIDRVLKGWGREGLSDQEILRRGLQCFDALYAFLQRK